MAQRKERVTKVIDGDTFMTDKRKNPVRLANVDTPEKRQPGYMQAKNKLERLVGGVLQPEESDALVR